MAKTEFEVFAQKIATYFQGDLSPEEFTRTLLRKFISIPMVTLCYMTWAWDAAWLFLRSAQHYHFGEENK